jgi:hypothetical protein
MNTYINRLMARFGYVPAPAKMAPTSIPLTIEVDSTQVAATLDLLKSVITAAHEGEAAIHRLNVAAGVAPSTGAAASGLPG